MLDKLDELKALYELAKKHLDFKTARGLLDEIVEYETSQATKKTVID